MWWGRKGRVRGINATLLFFQNLKCRRSSICLGKFLPWDSRLRETAKPLPPLTFILCNSACLFSLVGAYGAKPIKTPSKPASVPRSFSISNKRNHLAVSARKQITTRSIHIQNTLFRFLVLLRAYCKTR